MILTDDFSHLIKTKTNEQFQRLAWKEASACCSKANDKFETNL